VGIAVPGIQFNGALELPFRTRPVPLVPVGLNRQNGMGFGIRFVQCDRLQSKAGRSSSPSLELP
jgi:hypothetical protein